MFCKQQVAQLRGYLDRIRARGAELVVVGNGALHQARRFRAEQGVTFPLYTDPTRHSYEVAGLHRGLASTFSPRVALHGAKAIAAGFRQSHTQGDALQQGGVFVIAPGGRVLFEYRSREAGDHPNPERLLAALA